MEPSRKSHGGFSSARRAALVLAVGTIALLTVDCSHKSPVGVDQGGQPEIFFNWLPAFLVDQGAASQPCHEIMQWLDDDANFPRQDRLTELQTMLSRRANCTAEYRQLSQIDVPGDDPILGGIDTAIEEAQAYLNDNLEFEPRLQRLQKDGG